MLRICHINIHYICHIDYIYISCCVYVSHNGYLGNINWAKNNYIRTRENLTCSNFLSQTSTYTLWHQCTIFFLHSLGPMVPGKQY